MGDVETASGHKMIGRRFGAWAVIAKNTQDGAKNAAYLCQCVCGEQRSVLGFTLRNGRSTSCGCQGRQRTVDAVRAAKTIHGEAAGASRSKEWRAWDAMKRRCLYPSMQQFPRYGGRGIVVCDLWLHSFDAFLADVGRAPTAKHQLGRIDHDRGYEPGNVEWQTPKEQGRKTSRTRSLTCRGETLSLQEWADRTGTSRTTIARRIDVYGYSAEEAVFGRG